MCIFYCLGLPVAVESGANNLYFRIPDAVIHFSLALNEFIFHTCAKKLWTLLLFHGPICFCFLKSAFSDLRQDSQTFFLLTLFLPYFFCYSSILRKILARRLKYKELFFPNGNGIDFQWLGFFSTKQFRQQIRIFQLIHLSTFYFVRVWKFKFSCLNLQRSNMKCLLSQNWQLLYFNCCKWKWKIKIHYLSHWKFSHPGLSWDSEQRW